jgi:hypothetical protein
MVIGDVFQGVLGVVDRVLHQLPNVLILESVVHVVALPAWTMVRLQPALLRICTHA